MQLPWLTVDAVPAVDFAALRRRAIFECCKWDPQIEDVCALSSQPIVLRSTAWTELAAMAEQLANETITAENAIVRQPKLIDDLGLPRALRRELMKLCRRRDADSNARDVRLIRFDFHFTADGWRISEANSDVPGGFNEASGFARLVAAHLGDVVLPGDPTRDLAKAVANSVAGTGRAGSGTIALVHATAFTDDRQVMEFFCRELRQMGLSPVLVAPDHLRWNEGQPFIETEWFSGPVDFVFRFFPAEWLPQLPRSCAWPHLLGDSLAGLCNPGTSILTQSKRFPLVWGRLEADLPNWRALLPRTFTPRAARTQLAPERIVWKCALGRVGDFIGMHGITSLKESRAIASNVRWHPGHWIAQERFDAVPMRCSAGDLFPCIGVYTVNGKASGAYGRLARTPLINHLAQDGAVLIDGISGTRDFRATPTAGGIDTIPHRHAFHEFKRTLSNLGA
ncbi:MAG TPA: glutathionylspermidine synthase family protein [Verrucomicrobiae bacterium]|nr:glutathionylspermidine synthase family protein [Verrucomicrobiae bacterium]